MTAPIDLDLVELRCKLRGWPALREEGEVTVTTPAGIVWVRPDLHVGDMCHPQADECAAILTAPRWTLERLLSEPPEGWRVTQDQSCREDEPTTVRAILCWGSESTLRDGGVVAEVIVWTDRRREMSVFCNVAASKERRTLARLSARHKAAADLALILAEVEP